MWSFYVNNFWTIHGLFRVYLGKEKKTVWIFSKTEGHRSEQKRTKRKVRWVKSLNIHLLISSFFQIWGPPTSYHKNCIINSSYQRLRLFPKICNCVFYSKILKKNNLSYFKFNIKNLFTLLIFTRLKFSTGQPLQDTGWSLHNFQYLKK